MNSAVPPDVLSLGRRLRRVIQIIKIKIKYIDLNGSPSFLPGYIVTSGGRVGGVSSEIKRFGRGCNGESRQMCAVQACISPDDALIVRCIYNRNSVIVYSVKCNEVESVIKVRKI